MNCEFAELTIRDYSGAKIDYFKWSLNDKALEKKIFYILKSKYGIFQKREDKDLNWLKDSD